MNSSEPSAAVLVQSESLPGSRSFLHRGLARDFLLGAAAQPFVGALDHEIEQPVGLQRIARQPVVERVLDGLLDDALGFGGGEPVLGLALELRLAHEHRQHHGGAHHDVFRGRRRRRACPGRRARRDPSSRAAARCACPIRGCRRPASAPCCSRTKESRRRPRSMPPPIRRRRARRCGRICRRRYPDAPACRCGSLRRDNPSTRPGSGNCPRRGHLRDPSTAPASQRQRISTPPNR